MDKTENDESDVLGSFNLFDISNTEHFNPNTLNESLGIDRERIRDHG